MIKINNLTNKRVEARIHLQKNLLDDMPWGERKGFFLTFRQLLTHQEIISLFQEVHVSSEKRDFFLKKCPSDWILVKQKEIKNTFAFPKTVDAYLRGGNQTFTLFF